MPIKRRDSSILKTSQMASKSSSSSHKSSSKQEERKLKIKVKEAEVEQKKMHTKHQGKRLITIKANEQETKQAQT